MFDPFVHVLCEKHKFNLRKSWLQGKNMVPGEPRMRQGISREKGKKDQKTDKTA